MSPSKESQNYQIMSSNEIRGMYQDTILRAEQAANDFYQQNQSKTSPEIPKQHLIWCLKKAILLSNRYNADESKILQSIIQSKTKKEATDIVSSLREDAQKIFDNFKALEEIGLIRRKLYGVQFPKIFENRSRIYLKTKPILSETDLMQDIVDYLNHPLLKNERFSFSTEIKDNNKQKDGFVKRIWLNQKQPMKPVAKLQQYEIECLNFLNILEKDANLKNQFFRFITKIPNTEKLNLFFAQFRKKKNFPPCRLDVVFLRHLKSYKLKNPEHMLSALQNMAQKLHFFHTQLHEILIKPLNDQSTDAGIDTIILSTDAKDISSMSTFAQWESCMSNNGPYFQDCIMQIGTGSIIAYGVNSKNPQKKLARILLKPYETAKTLRQRAQYLHAVDMDVTFPEIHISKNLLCDYADMNQIKRQFIEEQTSHLEEEDLILDPTQVERIYKIDKTYGQQNPAFKKILESFINKHLNTNTVPGTYMVVDSMYLDVLQQSYQIYDKYDRDNLIKYLINNRISYEFDSNNIIHTPYLNLVDVPNLHLRPLSLRTLTLSGYMLDREIKYISAEKMFIENMDTFQSKTFPQNIHISNVLAFENSTKQFDMPFGISAPKICAANTKLISVAPDVKTEELIIPNTYIATLPPLEVKSLDVSGCMRLRHIPSNMVVTNLFNASNSLLETLPALSVNTINVNNCSKLTTLDPDICFNQLKADYSGLTQLPKNLNAVYVFANNSQIFEIPSGCIIQEMSLNETQLIKIHPNVKIQSLSISHTPIETIPSGLKFYKLNVSHCQNLKNLPDDIVVEGSLNLTGSMIQKLPVLNTQNIHLNNCPNITELPEGLITQNLFAAKSGLTTLPQNLSCYILSCPQSKLKHLPTGVQAYSIDARHTPLSVIEDNVVVDTLNISHTPIHEINETLRVKNLEAVNCQNLTSLSLPKSQAKKINLMGSNLSHIHHIETQILNITNCKNITSLNDHVSFCDLTATNSRLKELPNNLTAGNLNIAGCPIKQLPENLVAVKLDASETNIENIPQSICCDELILDDTKINIIPEDIQVKYLSLQNTPVDTIYHSHHFEEIIVSSPVKFIHPCIPNHVIKGMNLSQIKQAKHNFKQRNKNQKILKQRKENQRERD